MGFWKWRVTSEEDVRVKKENVNRASVITTRSRRSVISDRQSVLSNNPKVPPWEVIIDQYLAQCLRAAKLRDFTYFRLSAALNAKPEVEQIDFKQSLLSIIDSEEPLLELEFLNRDKCAAIRSGFSQYVKGIRRSAKEHVPEHWLEWGRLLDTEEERMIEILTTRIKETSEEAKTVIRSLDFDARDIAANVWVQGSGTAMACFRTMCSQIKVVSGCIEAFETGDFGILSQAEEKVKSAVEAGMISVFDRSGNAPDIRIIDQ